MTSRRETTPDLIWKFIRGDLGVSDFEKWLYSNETLEKEFGDALYFSLISANYRSKDEIDNSKKQLIKFVKNQYPQKCHCVELADTTVIDMGDFSLKVFASLLEVKKRGGKYWWLSIYKCNTCSQVWLVGSEERHNDIYCFKRLSEKHFTEVCEKNIWPPYFETFESLLKLGYEAGARVSFVAPYDSSLQYTIQDLAEEHHGITVKELSKLLNIEFDLALELSKKVISKFKVNINLK